VDAPAPIQLPRIVDLATLRPLDGDRAIEREIEEVTAAILLAADGWPSRVLVCNLVHSAEVAEAVADLADELEVDVELLERVDGRGCDVALRVR
jgi:hypothetical protein